MRADAAAVRQSHGDRAPLASALLAFGDSAHPGVGIAPDRVDHLLGRPVASGIPRAWIIVAAVTLAAVVVAATVAVEQSAWTGLTLNLPWLSSQPCVLVLAAIPIIAAIVALPRRDTASTPPHTDTSPPRHPVINPRQIQPVPKHR